MPFASSKVAIAIALGSIALVSACSSSQSVRASATAEKDRKPAPNFTLKDANGQSVSLADYKGKVVLLNFWATWCGPCLKEMPELSALAAMRQHVEVIGLDYEDIQPADLRAFLQKHPVVYPVAIVDVYNPPKDFDPPRGLPTTYLIGPDGKVAKHFLGPVTARDIDDAISAAGGPKVG